MSNEEKAVLYEDDFGFAGSGEVFYPEALRPIAEVLAELNRDEILQFESFNANIRLYLELIVGRFRSFHDTHRAAQAIHDAYRAENRQYCVYLRSFVSSGVVLRTGSEGQRLTQQLGFSSSDRDFREFLKAALPAGVESLSFINTFDAYPSGGEAEAAAGYLRKVTIPSLRVLSHNWKEVVREVIRGAKCIVLNVQGESEGVDYELGLIRECGMANRTIVARRGNNTRIAPNSFHDIVDLGDPSLGMENESAAGLAQRIHSLSSDEFAQNNDVEDLSSLRCWVIDRQIDAAGKLFDPKTLAGIPYDLYIPSSLASNWALLTEGFPKLVEEWGALEARAGMGHPPDRAELVNALYSALSVFYVGVTVERYYEMAIALSTIGMAHRGLTGDKEIMAACYRHAAECAEWHGDSALTDFLADAHSRLEQEIAADD